MKARLIGKLDPRGTPTSVYAIAPEQEIPEGFGELELEGPFRGTVLRDASHPTLDAGLLLCNCGHDRRSHVQSGQECRVRRNFEVCECSGFEEAE